VPAVILLVCGVVMLAVLSGLLAAVGGVRPTMLLAGMLLGLSMLAMPLNWIMWVLVVASFFVVGQLFYFGGLGQALWLPYGFGLVLYGKWFTLRAFSGVKVQLDHITLLVIGFLLAVALSVAVNAPNFLQAVATGKNFVGLWSVFFLVAAGLLSMPFFHRLWRVLLWALFFQIPIVAYQYLVVAPSRQTFGGVIGGVQWDAVVGGFGGHQEGGGASGAMAFFACLMTIYAVALYRRGQAKLWILIAVVFSSTVCVVLAEVKVVVVLLPLAAFVLLAPETLRRPVLVLSSALVTLILGFLLLLGYESVHYQRSADTRDPVEVVTRAFGYSLDVNQINMRSGEMGRVAAVAHWWREVAERDGFHAVFGYGPGASRSQSLVGAGDMARRYPFKIDRSTATQLLWDVGLFGFFCYFALLSAGAWKAARLARQLRAQPAEAALLDTASVGLAMMVLMTFYGRDPLEVPALAVLTSLMLGFVVWRWRVAHPLRPSARAVNPFTGTAYPAQRVA
jgi:hypothetical protein